MFRRGLARLISIPVLGLQAVVSAVVGYLVLLTAVAWWTKRRRSDPAGRVASTRFLIVVPAHNEQEIIATTLTSLQALDYPGHLVDLRVVADNCSDDTVAIARSLGVTVHDRRDPDHPGKGPAMQWLLDQVWAEADASDGGPDAVVVVDADSTLSTNFLRAMDGALADGATVAQGFYSVTEPGASTSIALRYAALSLRHYLRPLGRNALGASCGLFGNGMVFRSEVLRGHRWTNHLTEDAELQMALLLEGHVVRFVPDAVVEAEMPDTLEASTTQNERWELGRVQVARRFVPTLVRSLLRPGTPQRVARLDAVVDQVVPPLSVVGVLTAGAAVASTVLRLLRPTGATRWGAVAAVVSVCGLVWHVVSGLRMVRAPRSVYRAMASAPRAVLWKAVLWVRVLLRPERVGWVRTRRNAESAPDEG
jgi:1,2-diacylglycerol 3-beta-glucosyltransferase